MALAEELRRCAKAKNSKPLRTSRAVYWITGSPVAEPLSLQPVARNVVEILRIRADLLKQSPRRSFDVREALLALIFSTTFFHQAVLVLDALQGAVADGEIKLTNETASAKMAKRFAQLDELGFQSRGSLLVLMLSGHGSIRASRKDRAAGSVAATCGL